MKNLDPKEQFVIGLDLGTSVIKGVLMAADGHLCKEVSRENQFRQTQDGWIELDPELHYRNVCGVIRELAAEAPSAIAGVAMAAASGNTLLTDGSGHPLRPIINWMDRRAEGVPLAALAGLTAESVAQVSGWPCVTSFPLAQLAWLKEHEPETYRAAAHYGMDTDWLLYRLTGLWRMDTSTATTSHLLDQVHGCFHQPFLKRLEISEACLSPLMESGVALGPLTAQARQDTGLGCSTRVVSGSFDHPAAARAAGVLRPGQLMLSCGTSWVGFVPHASREVILKAKLLCDPFLSASDGPWAGMFSVPCIGRTIDWYVTHVIAPDERDKVRVFDELAARAEPGAGGLRIDLREPPAVPLHATRQNVARAVMEGAARLLNGKLEEARTCGFTFERAVMVGGPSRSPVWPGIVAEITGLEVTSADRSAGARGAAILAGMGCGLFRGEETLPTGGHHERT
jgi:sugar (pentulose or hexulose) kinase